MPIQTISPQHAKALIAGGDVDVVDVRDPRDWAAGHVPGARNVPLEDLTAGPPLARDKIPTFPAYGLTAPPVDLSTMPEANRQRALVMRKMREIAEKSGNG